MSHHYSGRDWGFPGDATRSILITNKPAADGRFVAAFAMRWSTRRLCRERSQADRGIQGAGDDGLRSRASGLISRQWTTLTDDAVDVFLPILTNGKLTGDKLGPPSDLLANFPYLGPPHAR